MFDRFLKIINEEGFEKIKNAKILLIGIGGVGGYTLEALIRSGVENITIVDNDIVEETNLNRQLVALHSTLNKTKTTVAKERCLDINPNTKINEITEFIDKDNIVSLFNEKYDYIIDACDTITTKVLLVKYAKENNIKIISCMGTGNRLDPTKLNITKLNRTYGDPLAKVMRKLLKENNISLDIPVVWSSEEAIKTDNRIPGSSALVPSVAGIYLASYVINDILNN